MFPGRGKHPTRRVNLSWKMKNEENNHQSISNSSACNTPTVEKTEPLTSQQLMRRDTALHVSSVHTGRGPRPERASAAAGAVTVEVGGFVGVDSLTVHLV